MHVCVYICIFQFNVYIYIDIIHIYTWKICFHKISIRLGEKFFQFYSCYSLLSYSIDTTKTIFSDSLYTNDGEGNGTHSSTLARKIPWMEETGGLPSMGSHRVGHNWMTSLSPFTFMLWRRKWQPTPVFLPGESQGRGSLVGCHLWGRTESDMTEVT